MFHITNTYIQSLLAYIVDSDYQCSVIGRIWSLQHLCRIATRRILGAARRKRIKELPIPKHLVSYLCCLPVAKSDLLHQNWERIRSNKCEAIRKKGASRRRHERLGSDSPAGSGISAVRYAGRNGGVSMQADHLHQEHDDASGNKSTSSREDKSDVIKEQSHRGIAGAETVDLEEEFQEEYVGPNGREDGPGSVCMSEDEARVASPNDGGKRREDSHTSSNGTATGIPSIGAGHTSQQSHLTQGEREAECKQELSNISETDDDQHNENCEGI